MHTNEYDNVHSLMKILGELEFVIENNLSKNENGTGNIIDIFNLSKNFGEVVAVDNVSLSIKQGEFVTLLGASGCGKTTLLKIIAGLEVQSAGKIFFEGRDGAELSPSERPTNTVFQKYALFPHLNVFNNIAFGLKLQKVACGEKTDKKGNRVRIFRNYSKSEISSKVNRALSVVGLDGFGTRNVATLSGGQAQRVAIARAIVLEPKVLLLDEPLGALDLQMRREMQQELKRLHSTLGITFVYVTHDQSEAFAMSDRVAVMRNGRIEQIGSPKEIYDRPVNLAVAEFLGESNVLKGVVLDGNRVSVLGKTFPLEYCNYIAGDSVNVLIRPHDMKIIDDSDKTQISGIVRSSVFVGTHYDVVVSVDSFELKVRSDNEQLVGQQAWLLVAECTVV